MGSYTVLQWTTFFMLYSIFGWCFESAYCSIKSGHLQNRGFCHGPWVPLYGVGSCLLVFLTHGYEENGIYLFMTGLVGGTLLELITGVIMNKIFHMRWWDYSKNPLNFRGYVCLPASIGWGGAALIVMKLLHPRISSIPEHWSYITFVVLNTMFYTLFVEDLIFSTIAALELRERVSRLAANSEEIQSLRKSIAEVYEKLSEAKAGLELSAEELRYVQKNEGNVAAAKFMADTVKDSTVAMANSVKRSTVMMAGTVKDSVSAVASTVMDRSPFQKKSWEALEEDKDRMEERLAVLEDGGNARSGKMHWWTKTMLRNNPEAVSSDKGFDDLKSAALKPLKEKKRESLL